MTDSVLGSGVGEMSGATSIEAAPALKTSGESGVKVGSGVGLGKMATGSGVGVAVAGGVLYGKRDTPQFNPDPKVCDDLGQNPVCLWEYPTTIYGALLGGAAIGTGIWLLVKFGREHRVSLEIERKP